MSSSSKGVRAWLRHAVCVALCGSIGCQGAIEQRERRETAADVDELDVDAGAQSADADQIEPRGDMSATLDEGGATHEDMEQGEPACLPTRRYFAREVMTRVVSPSCQGCHNARGVATLTGFVLEPTGGRPDYMERNLETLTRLANLRSSQHGDLSLLLLKPSGVVDHGGGEIFSTSSEEYAVLEEFVERVSEQDPCPQADDADFFAGVIKHTPESLWRKTTLSLGDRLPTQEERDVLEEQGEGALEGLLDGLLDEPAFYERLKEGYNDILLTDAHVIKRSTEPMSDLDGDHYPDRHWYDQYKDDGTSRRTEGIRASRWGLGRGPLELVAHVVREGRPFTEVLTADYMMVNFAAAKSLGVEDRASFAGQEDIEEFVEVRLPPTPEAPYASDAFPHAGLLTDYMYWDRYPSTDSNRNRMRVRMVYDHFLATDVLKIAPRGGDPSEIVDYVNPLRDSSQCSVCHTEIDPVGGALQNFDNSGHWEPRRNGWYVDSFSPGFGDALLPAGERYTSERWLAHQIVQDSRFAEAVVGHVWQILFGRAPLTPPEDADHPYFSEQMRAYEVQRDYLTTIHKEFVASNYDLKLIFKRLILSTFYRIKGAEVGLNEARRVALQDLGTSRLLAPQQLHRRVETLLGYRWSLQGRDAAEGGTPELLDIRRYELPTSGNDFFFLYGGIDSDSVTARASEPSGVMAAIAQLMANDTACKATALDFARDAEARVLFPFVTLEDVGDDTQSKDRIAQNITYLLDRLLDVQATAGDADFDLFLGLFQEVRAEGKARLDAEQEEGELAGPCTIRLKEGDERYEGLVHEVRYDELYTARAWRAVLSAMLQSYEFIYEQ